MARDKFAAMASRSAANAAPAQESGQHSQSDLPESSISTPAAPRRDKLAAMASRTNTTAPAPAPPAGSRGNSKLAAMAASAPSSAPPEKSEEDAALVEKKRLEEIQQRLNKRQKILDNLDRAEELTCKLLKVAHQTTKALENLSGDPNLPELSRTYRETLRELHPLLTEDTKSLIRAYENHTAETKKGMYGARVELRLATERTQVLKAMTELAEKRGQAEEKDGNSESESKKRPRE